MSTVLEEEGVAAAIERYRELRATYMGSRAYDFGSAPLNGLAQQLGSQGAGDALRLLELNDEFNPSYLPTLILLGNSLEANGDNESALRVYRSMIELDPATRFYDFYAGQARQRIAAIGR